jgi:hypothetical protein|tara:strand:+ start:1894 stop:2496 length:603 start_codon:yes stop_codon:yes gene_type:complete
MPTITDFKNNFKGGVRPNLFQVVINAPVFGQMDLQFLGKSTSLPASTVTAFDVPYRGRQLKVPGDRTFADWSVTILNDPNWVNRTKIEQWMNAINNHSQNRSNLNPSDVYGNATVSQLSRNGGVIRTYRIQDMIPTEAAAIELAMDSNDAVEEFAVTFAINNFTVDGSGLDGGSQGNGVDVSVSGTINLGGVSISGGINL